MNEIIRVNPGPRLLRVVMSLRDGCFYKTRGGYRFRVARPNTDDYRLLTLLAAGRGRVYSWREILWALRPGEPRSPRNTVNGAIYRLNDKLLGTNLLIEPVARRGYRLTMGD